MACSDTASFTDDQRLAYQALVDGRNVFLTGEAGTGKSFVLEAFIEHCKRERRQILAMAPTGIAALNLTNGTTIHRTLGIPANFCDPNAPIGLPRKVLQRAEVIIIDEISMCRIDLFERVVRMIVAAQSATGTKQVVLVGDFFQLSPVVTQRDLEAMMAFYPGNPDGYCFKSNFWKGLNLEAHVLRTVHRTVEEEYVAALNLARNGDPSCIPFFNRRAVNDRSKVPADALWLCTRNANADNINAARLANLPGSPAIFVAKKDGNLGKGDAPTSDELPLKVGARVMSVLNDKDGRFLNGTLGTVVDVGRDGVEVVFDGSFQRVEVGPHTWKVEKAVVVDDKDENGDKINRIMLDEVGSFTQLPLRLAWAVTIHKAQGQTIMGPVAVESHAFTCGQLYVGLSRSVRAEDITVYPKIEPRYLKARREIQEFYDEISEGRYELKGMQVPGMAQLPPEVARYIAETGASVTDALMHFVSMGIESAS